MSLDQDSNVTLLGELELAEHAGHLFGHAQEEFECAASDLNTWVLAEVRDQIVAAHRSRPAEFKVRKLYNPAVLADEESERHVLRLVEGGVEVRICTTRLPQETIILDRRIAVLAGPRPATEFGLLG